jgi:hypothetical protein
MEIKDLYFYFPLHRIQSYTLVVKNFAFKAALLPHCFYCGLYSQYMYNNNSIKYLKHISTSLNFPSKDSSQASFSNKCIMITQLFWVFNCIFKSPKIKFIKALCNDIMYKYITIEREKKTVFRYSIPPVIIE